MDSERLDFPATWRNREPIAEVLDPYLSEGTRLLEVASGSGQHLSYLAERFPQVRFQPSDVEPAHLASIDSYCRELDNVSPALLLDVTGPWPALEALDLVLAINLIHISPWEATRGLLLGAAAALKPGGHLYLYGAYRRDGRHTATSNESFDRSLRAQNPAWGVRDLKEVEAEAAHHGFTLTRVEQMPANNLSVFFQR